jgi:MFS family permease
LIKTSLHFIYSNNNESIKKLDEDLPPAKNTVFLKIHHSIKNKIRLDALAGNYGKIIFLLLGLNLSVYLAVPLFPNFMVNTLGMSDQIISIGTAIQNISTFVGSTFLFQLSRKYGNQKVTAIGMILITCFPIFLAISSAGTWLYYIASICTGLGWGVTGGAALNFVLEYASEQNRPIQLAWYNLFVNLAVLLGSLIGPLVASFTGVFYALILFTFARLISAISIFFWK